MKLAFAPIFVALLSVSQVSNAQVSACDLSGTPQVFQTRQALGLEYSTVEAAIESAKVNALLQCRKATNNNPTCKIEELVLHDKSNGWFQARGTYSVTSSLIEDNNWTDYKGALRKFRCDQALRCLGSNPSEGLLAVVKDLMARNKCK